jgi:hypothetical protein
MEIEHVADGSIGKRRAVHIDVVLPWHQLSMPKVIVSQTAQEYLVTPVIDRIGMIDLSSKAANQRAWSPNRALVAAGGENRITNGFVCLFLGDWSYLRFLLDEALIQNWVKPLLKVAVVFVRDQQVADPVQAFFAQVGAFQGKISNVRRVHALDEILLDASSGRDDDVHLNQRQMSGSKVMC